MNSLLSASRAAGTQARAAARIVKFIALMLALTLIARGTSGATLAKVGTATPVRGEIVTAITGSATVYARGQTEITAPSGLKVEQMLVGAGQTIRPGDAVARFSRDEIAQKLARELANLDKLLLELKRLEQAEPPDAAAIDTAARALERARQDLELTQQQCETDIAAAQAALDSARLELETGENSALQSANTALARALEDYDLALANAQADIAAAQAALDEAAADTGLPSAIADAKTELERAQKDYQTAADYASSQIELTSNQVSAARARESAALALYQENPTAENEQNYRAAQQQTAQAEANHITVNNSVIAARESARRRAQDAQTAYDKLLSDSESSLAERLERAEQTLADTKANADQTVKAAARRLEDAQKDFALKAESPALAVDAAQKALDSALARAEDSLLAAERRVEDAELTLDRAYADYEYYSSSSAQTAEQNRVNAAALRLDAADAQRVVSELEALDAGDGLLVSNVEGTVSSSLAEGAVVSGAVVTFVDGAKGYEARMVLTKEDTALLAVGDPCEVTTGEGSMYYNPTVTATVSAVSAPDENDDVTVTLSLPPGNWSNGQRIDAQAVLGRSSYNMCVPLSAIRGDNSGYFVLVLGTETSVLGVEIIATRVPVSLLAQDRNMAAIDGPLGTGADIITSSSKAVSSGDRVRYNQ